MHQERETIRLVFDEVAVDVPIKTTVTTRLLKDTKQYLDILRARNANKALSRAIANNPHALTVITGNGNVNPAAVDEVATKISEEHKQLTGTDIDAQQLKADVERRLALKLVEEFPEVFRALQDPETVVDVQDAESVGACIMLIKLLINDKDLTTRQKELLNTAEFWDDVDLMEVVKIVDRFRAVIQRRTS